MGDLPWAKGNGCHRQPRDEVRKCWKICQTEQAPGPSRPGTLDLAPLPARPPQGQWEAPPGPGVPASGPHVLRRGQVDVVELGALAAEVRTVHEGPVRPVPVLGQGVLEEVRGVGRPDGPDV